MNMCAATVNNFPPAINFVKKLGRISLDFLIVILPVLITCGTAQALPPVNQAPHLASTVPASQVQNKTLVVGSEQDYPPFATGMTDETAGGFTVDLWKAVAAEAGLNYTIRVLPFHQLLQEFQAGRIDVLINLAQSDERHHFADFTVPHVIVHGAIFVRKGEVGVRTEDDLAGKSIIVLNADLAHDYAIAKGWGKQLVLVDTAAEGLRLLASGKHDAMLLSKLAGMQTLQTQGLSNIEPLKIKAGFSQKFSFAVHEGASELLGKINEGLALKKSDGTYAKLYDKWFGLYETREVGLSDLLKYIIPLIGLFITIAGYYYYQRRIERKQSEAALIDSRNLLMTIIDNAPIRVFWKDRDLHYLGCNTAFSKDGGLSCWQEVIGKDDYQMIWAAQADLYRADDRAVIDTGIAKLSYEEPQTTPDGKTIWLRTSKVPLRNQQGEIFGILGIYDDVTENRKLEMLLRTLSTAIEQSPVSIVIADTKANIEYVNPRFSEVTGYAADEVIGKNPRILQSGLTPKETYEELWDKLTNGQSWNGELFNKRKNGEVYWEEAHIAPVRHSSGRVTHFVAAKVDISQRKKMEEQILHLAHHDSLTKLPNRSLFTDRLQQALAIAKRDQSSLALMFIDLDKFKPVNDLLGHDIGDQLLIEVAQRIHACLRESDTVARIGGDEFVVLLPLIVIEQDAFGVAEKIHRSLNESFEVQGHILSISSSIGVVIYPTHGDNEIQLMKNADTAMYFAKAAGRDNVKIFQSNMRHSNS